MDDIAMMKKKVHCGLHGICFWLLKENVTQQKQMMYGNIATVEWYHQSWHFMMQESQRAYGTAINTEGIHLH